MKIFVDGGESYDIPKEVEIDTIEDLIKIYEKCEFPLIFNKTSSYHEDEVNGAKYEVQIYDHYLE